MNFKNLFEWKEFNFFQVSFFEPVYPNDDDENENDLLADGIPRPSFGKGNRNESNETLGTDTITNNDEEQSSEVKDWINLSLLLLLWFS